MSETGALSAVLQALASPCEPALSIVLGRRLHGMRLARGLSRAAVARRLGLSLARIKQHEQGTRRVEARELVAYSRLFRVRISAFFCDPSGDGEA
jgi:transcriptional regulator with XRE-family HTH domain